MAGVVAPNTRITHVTAGLVGKEVRIVGKLIQENNNTAIIETSPVSERVRVMFFGAQFEVPNFSR